MAHINELYLRTCDTVLHVHTQVLDYKQTQLPLVDKLSQRKGCLLTSDFEYPGRYTRWDIAFVNPPLEIIGYIDHFCIKALNKRGEVLLPFLHKFLCKESHFTLDEVSAIEYKGSIIPSNESFTEEERSRQPTLFSLIRALQKLLAHDQEHHFGLYGAFGYDLVFQFDPIHFKQKRGSDYKLLHVFLPDELILVDHRKEEALCKTYDFSNSLLDTRGLDRTGKIYPISQAPYEGTTHDMPTGEYAQMVEAVKPKFYSGDLFEVVLSRKIEMGYPGTPTDLFKDIRKVNPSPYGFLINLGEEQLVGASPEMFVRVEGNRVETCPISGTIRRGGAAMEDAENIKKLLNSGKDESELTMCTDVDRNDKSRVCEPGSVRLLGRRMIEAYSRLFHTVDHVEGTLRPEMDGCDAFLSHMWAVTLTGAPKLRAMQAVEDLEKSPREWYGGAVGYFGADGNINTGITIRTVHLKNGKAAIRVGATLLADSIPAEEEQETLTKSEAFTDAVLGKARTLHIPDPTLAKLTGKKILFVDNQDSFVHTLGNYVRQTGAEVKTLRAGFDFAFLEQWNPDLVFVSPGPGRPAEFRVPELVQTCFQLKIPVFGVCLGLQGMVEAMGGSLEQLSYPVHGKPSPIIHHNQSFLKDLPNPFTAGRYHSLYALKTQLPDCFRVLAETEDGIIMALEHKTFPMAAVQFHPESILTLEQNSGIRLLSTALSQLIHKKF
jgi:anthranilate synthase